MNLLWRIRPVWHPQARSAELLVDIAEGELLSRAKIQVGDVVGVVAEPAWLPGRRNLMRLDVVRDNRSGTQARRKKRNRG